jgi:hypothetical protein
MRRGGGDTDVVARHEQPFPTLDNRHGSRRPARSASAESGKKSVDVCKGGRAAGAGMMRRGGGIMTLLALGQS